MNLIDSCFLCLDIGTSGVRGMAHRIRSAKIEKSATFSVDSFDTIYAIKTVIDELEEQLESHFETAFITGNFGDEYFSITNHQTKWNNEHKISNKDITKQISEITPSDGFQPIHIIPMRYATTHCHDLLTPIGTTDTQLFSIFSTIFFEKNKFEQIQNYLRQSHICPEAFYLPQFLQKYVFKKNKNISLFIDLGAEHTTFSIWTDRGPVYYKQIKYGGNNITQKISKKLNISFEIAERIKKSVSNMIPKEMDRFTPADTEFDFSRADINDILIPEIENILNEIKNNSANAIEKFKPSQIILSGGGAQIDGINNIIKNKFNLPIENLGTYATVRALSEYLWNMEEKHRAKYTDFYNRFTKITNRISNTLKIKHKKKQKQFIPIMPSTLCFDMHDKNTYNLFNAGNISIIHVDIMDGFFVDNVAGGLDELQFIRANTNAHLHVHLMTESPNTWAINCIERGADTIILSPNTSGLFQAIDTVKKTGKRVGIALPANVSNNTLIEVIKLKLDEIMIMAVTPGSAGQQFDTTALETIKKLSTTKKKHGLKYVISVDGGINPHTAKTCWDAGADLLVSGSYLANSNEFPLALETLLKK